MKKILILQMRPEDETADSEFEAFLRSGKINRESVHRIRVEKLQNLNFDLSDYSAIIAGGSPFDVSKAEGQKSVVQKQVEAFFNDLFDEITALDFPFLGACSGNGLLGNYCGSVISGKYSEPVGSTLVFVTEKGAKDPLLKGLPKEFTALVGHKEACDDVPSGAELLITSDSCPVQMFRLKNNIYATQFHPEADVNEFNLRIDIYKDYGYFSPDDVNRLKADITGIKTPETKEILRRFVARYAP